MSKPDSIVDTSFVRLLDSTILDIRTLRSLSWHGVPVRMSHRFNRIYYSYGTIANIVDSMVLLIINFIFNIRLSIALCAGNYYSDTSHLRNAGEMVL